MVETTPTAVRQKSKKALILSNRRLWTRAEFEQAAERGVFSPEERLELVEGEIVQMPARNTPHSAAIGALQEALGRAFPTGYWTRIQLPLALGDSTRLEPDIAVVPGSWRDYRTAQPETAVLVVEVSDTTLAYDRTTKAGLYARAGIADYWIVNVNERLLEVHRRPAPSLGNEIGYDYQDLVRHDETAAISPLAAPEHSIPVADLLP